MNLIKNAHDIQVQRKKINEEPKKIKYCILCISFPCLPIEYIYIVASICLLNEYNSYTWLAHMLTTPIPVTYSNRIQETNYNIHQPLSSCSAHFPSSMASKSSSTALSL